MCVSRLSEDTTVRLPLLVCEGRRARHVAYTSSFLFLAAAVDIRVNNLTVNVGIQQLNNNAMVWLHLRMPLAQGQDPKCDIPGVTAYGTVTDPAISPFHIRTSSINRTCNPCYSCHLQQSPIHPSTQTTEPPPAARDPTVVWPTCPAYMSDLCIHPTCPTVRPHY